MDGSNNPIDENVNAFLRNYKMGKNTWVLWQSEKLWNMY